MHTVNAALKNNKLVGTVRYSGCKQADPEIKGNQMLIAAGKASALDRSNLEEFVSQIQERN